MAIGNTNMKTSQLKQAARVRICTTEYVRFARTLKTTHLRNGRSEEAA